MAKITKSWHNKQSRAKAKQRQPNDYFFVEVSPHFVLLKVTLIGAKALCLLGAMILLSTTGFSWMLTVHS